jgi:hypothetical protein
MAKEKDEKEKEKPGEIEWRPDMPLPDEEDETETNRVAQASARRKYLEDQHLKSLEKNSKEKGKDGKRKSLFG